jgi:Trk-type K+ transport system membrane component
VLNRRFASGASGYTGAEDLGKESMVLAALGGIGIVGIIVVILIILAVLYFARRA